LQCNIHQTYMCEMKLNKKSERKQTHNTVLTESGVFGLLCINIQKGESLLQSTKIGPALFLSSKCIFIQISIVLESQSFQRFSVTTKEIKHFNSLFLSLFGTRNLPLRMLCANDTLLHQLGYQLRRFCLIIGLESVTILHQLWQLSFHLLVFGADRT
jgi:hypothetical protein